MPIEATPRNEASRLALEVYRRTLDAVRGDRLIRENLQVQGDILTVQGQEYDLGRYQRIRLVGVGKASATMVSAAVAELGERVSDGIVVTKDEPIAPAPIETLYGAHPVPDERSLVAGRRVEQFAQSCHEGDLVLFFLSGGASALCELLPREIPLIDLQETTRRLLASGCDIREVNAVRSQISRIKGGGLARAFGPSTVVALVLSDVVGGSLASVGSGPLLPSGSPEIALSILDVLPDSVRRELLTRSLMPRTVPDIRHVVVGSVSLAVHAASDAARSLGLEPLAYLDPLAGEARTMARQVMSHAQKVFRAHPKGPLCLIFGGETAVTIRGHGLGGRAQEMAVAAAPKMSQLEGDCAFLSAGTDGTDGPTDAAGGLVDPESLGRARDRGFESRRSLVANDSYNYLRACGGLIRTGPTGSNVNDICLVIRAE